MALAAVLVAGLGGGVLIANAGDGSPDPDEVLADARSALSKADAYRFHVTSADHFTMGRIGGPGSDMTMRRVADGEVRGDDWHVRDDAGDDMVFETTSLGGELYVHSLFGDADKGWAHLPTPPSPSVDEFATMMGDMSKMPADLSGKGEPGGADLVGTIVVPMLGYWYLGALGSDAFAAPVPTIGANLRDVLDGLEHVEIVDRGGDGITLRGTKPAPRELAKAAPIPLPDGRFEIRFDARRRPVSLRLTVATKTATEVIEIRWSDWDAKDIAVTKPGGTIDETPWLDEQGIAAVAAGITPVAPTHLPAGYVLEGIDPSTAADQRADDENPGEPACDGLDLFWSPPAPDSPAAVAKLADGDEVDVTLISAACARTLDATPFVPGAYGSLAVRTDPDDDTVVDVLVGDTVAEVSTTLEGPEKVALITSLRPFDLAAAMAEFSARARTEGAGFLGG